MARIDRLSAWVLGHFAANNGLEELEAQLQVMDALEMGAPPPSSDSSPESFTSIKGGWTYTVSVASRVIVTEDSAGWAPVFSMSMRREETTISRSGVTVACPETIAAAHRQKMERKDLFIADIVEAQGLPHMPVTDVQCSGNATLYKTKIPKAVDWAYAKGRARMKARQGMEKRAA